MFGTRKPILFLLLSLAAFCAAVDNAVDPSATTEKIVPEPSVSTSPKPPTTTAPTTVAPTNATTKPTTTVTPTTPTTVTPPTTPTTPTTTATPPTTPSTPSTSPTPTTSPAPITTPKPAPFEAGTWQVLNENKTACILLHMKGVVDIYQKDGNQTIVEQIQIPTDAFATGNCSQPQQNIILSWRFNATLNDTVEIVFKKNDTKNVFDMETVKINVFVIEKNSTKQLNFNRTKEEFATPVSNSYLCKKLQMLNFTDSKTNETLASFSISDVQLQAFGNITNKSFATAKDCEPYETPDIVPIAVGCALIALIVFVLIGYLIGRRRNQTRGYLSM